MITLSLGDLIVGGGLLLALGGVVFQSGRLTARVEALEAWRAQMTTALDGIYSSLRRVEHWTSTHHTKEQG